AVALLLTLPAWLPTLALGLALLTVSMFSGATALQLGVASSTNVDRGVASAIYFCVYYTCGGLGASLPGLAWERWGWNGVPAGALGAVSVAMLALLSSRGTASARRRASRPARSASA